MQTTPRWGLKTPDLTGADATPDVPYWMRSLALQLDNVAMDLDGAYAAIPPAGQKGRYYFATDLLALYRDTGTAWVRVSTPAGTITSTAGTGAPNGHLLMDGSTYNRADYPELFAALGGANSPHGLPTGTTFKVPDARGRVLIHRDSGANVTAAATPVGAKGGEASHVPTGDELAAHAHAGTTGDNDHFLDHFHQGTTGIENSSLAHAHGFSGKNVPVADSWIAYSPSGPLGGSTSIATSGLTQASATQGGGPPAHTHNFSTAGPVNPSGNPRGLNHVHPFVTDNRGGDGAHNNLQPYLVALHVIKT